MKSSNSDPQPYNLIAAQPGTKPGLGRSGMIVITILVMLVLGLFVVAFVPQDGNADFTCVIIVGRSVDFVKIMGIRTSTE